MTITDTERRTMWTVDTAESSVEFAVRTFWGLHTVHGCFHRFGGSYDGAAIFLVVDAATLDTGNGTRDSHLRSDRFFDAAGHPRVRFVSTHVRRVGDLNLHVVGRLEAAGESVALEFPATLRELGDRIEIEATSFVDQSELGMSRGPLGMIREPAELHVRAVLAAA